MNSDWNDPKNGAKGSELPSELPLIPLLSTVVFPGMIVNLQVARARNLRLVEEIDDLLKNKAIGAYDPGASRDTTGPE